MHPLWSLDRDDWVRAGELEPGERLKSEAGPLVVEQVRELPSSHVVYNLEVAGDHKYLVGADGLLSHNNEGCDYPRDWFDSDTIQRGATLNSEGEARALAREKLGKNPVEIEDGKLRSRDGKWQYRAKPDDLTGHGPEDTPHVHLERLDPDTGYVKENWHLRWNDD
ncbi:MAG: polymorphic toxin-type HINT domain-containing protein [Myxococcota bacterium]